MDSISGPASEDTARVPDAGPVSSLLAFATRGRQDWDRVRAHVRSAFPGAGVTWLLPASFLGDGGSTDPGREVLVYPEGGVKTWPQKARILGALARRRFDACVFPMNFTYQFRNDLVALLPLLVRSPLFVLGESGEDTGAFRKPGFLRLYLRRYWNRMWFDRSRRAVLKARTLYYETLAGWLGHKLDVPAFFLLMLLARARRTLGRWRLALSRREGTGSPGDFREAGVVHFIDSLDTGGAQLQLLTLLAAGSGGPRPGGVFVFEPVEGLFEKRFQALGVSVTRIRRRPFAWDGGIGRTERFFWRHFPFCMTVLRVARLLRKRPRPGFMHNWLFLANIIGATAAALAGVPVIISSERNMSLLKRRWGGGKPWYRWADRLTADLNDRVVVNAERLNRDYRCWTGIAAGKVVTIPNGLDPAALPVRDPRVRASLKQEQGWTPETPVVGWVGRMAPEKDPRAFLHVCRGLLRRDEGIRFVMLGGGPLLHGVRAIHRRMGLEGVVRVPGGVPDARRWLEMMDVLVLTSIVEGMPNVLIEALFTGVPCVATDAGGAGEVLEDGAAGFVVPVGDTEALVDRAWKLLQDPDLRARFVEAGRRRAHLRFTAARMVRETQALHERLWSCVNVG